MGKKAPDKKLNRLSTILEIITNLGTIASWVLGIGSAYLLNVQKTPVIVPGIDFTLDLGFQFSLLISAMLGYIHFLQTYWEKNRDKRNLSTSFVDFSLWDLPRLRQPLLLIPIVVALAIFIQVSIKSYLLIAILVVIVLLVVYFSYLRFKYHLSPERRYEKLVQSWQGNEEWLDKWSKRIRIVMKAYIAVHSRDLYKSGMNRSDEDTLEIGMALYAYFQKYEFEEDLVLMHSNELNYKHPYHSYTRSELVLMPRNNLSLRTSEN